MTTDGEFRDGLSEKVRTLLRRALIAARWTPEQIEALLASRLLESPELRAKLDDELRAAFQDASAEVLARRAGRWGRSRGPGT